MAKSVVISVPHQASRAEVLARMRAHLPAIKARTAPFVTSMDERWEGDELVFAVSALGQRVGGRVAVDEEVVHIEIELPWAIAAIAGPLRRRVAHEATKLLARS